MPGGGAGLRIGTLAKQGVNGGLISGGGGAEQGTPALVIPLFDTGTSREYQQAKNQ
jgi:hypothetical protein